MSLFKLWGTLQDVRNARKFFGDNPDKTLKELQIKCHPDLYTDDDDKTLAIKLTQQIHSLYEEAKKPASYVSSSTTKYEICRPISSGDTSDLFYATDESENHYIAKRAKTPAVNTFLRSEFRATELIQEKTVGTSYSHFFQTPVEVLTDDKIYITMYKDNEGYVPFNDVSDQIGHNGRHVAWFFKRLISAVATVNSCGLVNCAVLPSHILVNPGIHGIRLLGFVHSVNAGDKLKVVSSQYKDWYPKNKVGYPALDMLLAAKTMLSVISSDIPNPIKSFIRSVELSSELCLKGVDTYDPWMIYDEFSALLKKVYGQSKWVELQVK